MKMILKAKRRMNVLKTVLAFIMVLTVNNLWGQKIPAKTNTSAKSPKTANIVHVGIQAVHYVKNRQIKIRWAPVNELSWRMSMKYGFIIERRTILRDGNMLGGADQIRSFVSYPAIKDSLKYWERFMQINDNAAVMAQALFGETFEIDINNAGKNAPNPGASLLSKAQENKQRFLFGMYAADNDYPVAVMAGLGYTDTAVRINEKYFYRIYSAAPKTVVKSDTAMLFVSPAEYSPLPPASDPMAEPSSKSIVVSWDMERTKSYYTGFLIERSEDGKTFRGLTSRPYTNMGQSNNPDMPNSVVFTDTTVAEGVSYKYRIAGVSIFGERGPWSSLATCKSLPLLDGVPGITGMRPTPGGEIQLNWYFEDSIRKRISGFEIQHSAASEGPYTAIIKDIDLNASSALLPDTLGTGYVMVKAISKDGLSRTSFPYMYQPEDSIPPAPPTGLTGVADSNGHVVLKWFANPEKDLLGYKVFRTMNAGTEFAILVDTVCYGTTFHDTLDMRLKNNKIYYSVTALDFRHNQSAFSKTAEVLKPDVIPPTSPVFADYKISDGKVDLEWVNSSDDDVAEFFLFRKLSDAGKWDTLIRTTRKDLTRFTDDKITPEKKYTYRVVVKDEAGHLSPESKMLTVLTLPKITRKAITDLESDVDRDKRMIYLRWKLPEGVAVKSVEVFRGDEKEPLSLYKVIEGKVNELLDNELLANTRYKYGIRVMMQNGQYSELVTKEVNY